MSHFSKWGMEIHSGLLDPLVHAGLLDCDALPEEKASKSEVLFSLDFCSKPLQCLHLYDDPATFDSVDLSPCNLPPRPPLHACGRQVPVTSATSSLATAATPRPSTLASAPAARLSAL